MQMTGSLLITEVNDGGVLTDVSANPNATFAIAGVFDVGTPSGSGATFLSIVDVNAGAGGAGSWSAVHSLDVNALLGGAGINGFATKAIIVLNPADPPMIMRNTVLALAETGDPDDIRRSVHEMVETVSAYVPGYRPTVEPQFSVTPDGTHRVAIFVEVAGAADFFPPYAGNLDIMTAAATQVGEQIAQHLDQPKDGQGCEHPSEASGRAREATAGSLAASGSTQ